MLAVDDTRGWISLGTEQFVPIMSALRQANVQVYEQVHGVGVGLFGSQTQAIAAAGQGSARALRALAMIRFSAPTAMLMLNPVNSVAIDAVVAALTPTFTELAQLEVDWDSYGAETISQSSLHAAKSLVQQVAACYSWLSLTDITPSVLPLGDGSVQVEWSGPKGRLDVEVVDEHEVNFLLMQREGDQETLLEQHEQSIQDVITIAERIFY